VVNSLDTNKINQRLGFPECCRLLGFCPPWAAAAIKQQHSEMFFVAAGRYAILSKTRKDQKLKKEY